MPDGRREWWLAILLANNNSRELRSAQADSPGDDSESGRCRPGGTAPGYFAGVHASSKITRRIAALRAMTTENCALAHRGTYDFAVAEGRVAAHQDLTRADRAVGADRSGNHPRSTLARTSLPGAQPHSRDHRSRQVGADRGHQR